MCLDTLLVHVVWTSCVAELSKLPTYMQESLVLFTKAMHKLQHKPKLALCAALTKLPACHVMTHSVAGSGRDDSLSSHRRTPNAVRHPTRDTLHHLGYTQGGYAWGNTSRLRQQHRIAVHHAKLYIYIYCWHLTCTPSRNWKMMNAASEWSVVQV